MTCKYSGCYFLLASFINNSALSDDNNWGATICDVETNDGLLIKGNTVVGCRPWATSVTIPENVTSIGKSAFYECTGVTALIIPSGVSSISAGAFYGCTGLNSFVVFKYYGGISNLPNSCNLFVPSSTVDAYKDTGANVIAMERSSSTQSTITISNNAPEYIKLKSVQLGETVQDVVNGTVVLKGLAPDRSYSITVFGEVSGIAFSYSISVTTKPITVNAPTLVKVTNTELTLKGSYNAGDAKIEYTGFCNENGEEYGKGDELTLKGLAPGESLKIYYIVRAEGGGYSRVGGTYTTQKITANAKVTAHTASSATLKGSLSGWIDATISDVLFWFYDYGTQKMNIYESGNIKVTGLTPNTSYNGCHFVTTFAELGAGSATCEISFKTDALTLVTQQPKVISEGNVIVAAKSNLDDDETNVGFEWRRQDWTDDFDSKTGGAYLYNGEMEGYIRNINANYLWKFRPYYEANDGTRYYGEWKGLDPSDYSYFEPTVHTYASVTVNENTAEVKGYAQRGTDNVTSQGFLYWPSSTANVKAEQPMRVTDVPSDALKVTAKGTVMNAKLTDLLYNTTYSYVAFVETSEGETFYGEEMTFQTGEDLTGIVDVNDNGNVNNNLSVIYDLSGRKLSRMQKGINIIRKSNGSTRKVLVK